MGNGGPAARESHGNDRDGQVVFPLVGPLVLPTLGRRYLKGLDRLPTHTLYTSRGLGGVPPFARLNAPPEVTVLTLTRGQGSGVRG